VRTFLRQLFENGRVTVPFAGQPFEPAVECEAEARAFDRSARLEFPPGLPEFALHVAMWAAERLGEIARLIVVRAAGPDEFAPAFSVPCPAAPSQATDYSADLFLRHLPALWTFTGRLSPGDPLLPEIVRFAAAWPLSSVGMKLAAPPDAGRVAGFAENSALLRVYADRILATEDISRLGVPAVDRAVRDALGAHPELCPAIARALDPGNSACAPCGTREAPAQIS
jgi:hypothetical protein